MSDKRNISYSGFLRILFVIIFNQAIVGQLIPEIRDGGNYKIRNIENGKYLTVMEQGIVGLRTGMVGTLKDNDSMAQAQSWTLTWEPLPRQHQGYWIQSRKEYLNAVTSFYIPNTSIAQTNVWKLKYVGDKKWQIKNTRNGLCLQLAKNKRHVYEDKCLTKNASSQQWNLLRIIVVPVEEEIFTIPFPSKKKVSGLS